MNVAIRTDASVALGTGHVMRCLTLAAILRMHGAKVHFVCRELDGHLCNEIETQGYAVSRLPQFEADTPADFWQDDAEQTRKAIAALSVKADLLTVDHYALDARWESAMRQMARAIFVMDDLADRPHDCDILLDQGLRESPKSRYADLVQPTTKLFIGPQYALLRPEFDQFPPRLRDQGLRRLFVFFGGTDPDNETLKVVSALRCMGAATPLTKIVLGPANPHAKAVQEAVQGLSTVSVIGATREMAALMDEADLGIGACGGAAWERCALGLPSLVAIIAENQREDSRILHAMGAVRNLGDASAIGVEHWVEQIRNLQDDAGALRGMSRSSAAVMHGRESAMQALSSALVGRLLAPCEQAWCN